MKKKNQGFTLVELIIVVAIFAILLGIMVPSLNAVLGFRVQRAANSIGAALDKTKIEAMSRLVGEMKLEKKADGYYISYYLDRGKKSGVQQEQAEKIAPAKTQITYTTSAGGEEISLETGMALLLTYDRETGGFLPIQSEQDWDALNSDEGFKNDRENIPLSKSGEYCETITVKGGYRTRVIELYINTGSYDIHA